MVGRQLPKLMTYLSSREVAIAQSGSVRPLSGKADIRTF